jgi:cytochrome c oxidase subunit IV
MSSTLVPRSTYFAVFAALMVLTATTVGVSFLDLGPFNTVVALAIAVSKMMLVMLFFMHLRSSSRLTWLVVLSGFFFFAILVALSLNDYLTRGPGWLHYG